MARKRGNGEGSITKYKDGRWCARYTAQTAEGPKRRAIYAKTRQQVAEKLNKVLAERDEGLVFDAKNRTVADHLERWLKDSVKASVKPATFESYSQQVRKHIVPSLGRIKLKSLGPAHLQAFYRSKLDSGLSPRTVQYQHVILHKASSRPCGGVSFPATSRRPSTLPGCTGRRCSRSPASKPSVCFKRQEEIDWKRSTSWPSPRGCA